MDYNFLEIEKKWQTFWLKNKTFKTIGNGKPKYYILDMFPYPSGSGLHIGHPLGYIASDIISRFKRLKGFNVLHPMGFDSFGLPAEQYAVKTGQHPKITTDKNIKKFKKQLDQIGLSYDWDREIRTSDEKYYKWTQWIFLKLYNSYFDEKKKKALPIEQLKFPNNLSKKEKIEFINSHRLAYEDEVAVNWCQELGTVLSNEEVINGLSERGGYPVIRRPMKQWMMRITKYADRLLNDLNSLDWPESIKISQKNWIGKSKGAEIYFSIYCSKEKIKVFTTRPDTIYGATYLVLAPEHKLVKEIVTYDFRKQINVYTKNSLKKSDLERQELEKEKTGEFTGSYAINPINNKKIPIWISDYVLSTYGTGAIMAVPAHDERDFQFAKKFDLPIVSVIKGEGYKKNHCFIGTGKMINSGEFNGLNNFEFGKIICKKLESIKKGRISINYKFRDWVFTRQRYWGEPIPIIHKKNGEKLALSKKELPLILPEVKSYLPTKNGKSPLARNNDWVNIKVNKEICRRESNTMPQWAGSCWYYLRFLDPNNKKEFSESKKIKYWMPVDLYVGGAEHAVLHLLYSRFWHKVLYDLRYVNTIEPFKKLVNQGMILGRSNFIYRIRNSNKFVSYNLKEKYDCSALHVDINLVKNDILDIKKFKNSVPEYNNAEFILENNKYICGFETEKMSKSKSNVVNPDEIINNYGADTLRMYEMFLGPLEQSKPWNTNGIDGVLKFLKRFYNLFFNNRGEFKISNSEPNNSELKILHKAIKKIDEDINNLSLNTSVSALMISVNKLTKLKCDKRKILEPLLIVLSPFAPHISEELWEKMGNKKSISSSKYPTFNKHYLEEESYEYPIMINGKLRTKQFFLNNASKKEIEKKILKNKVVIKWAGNKEIKKIIIVNNKIINVVV